MIVFFDCRNCEGIDRTLLSYISPLRSFYVSHLLASSVFSSQSKLGTASFLCIASAPSPVLLSRTLVWRWSTRRSLVTWSSLFFSILTCFAQIAPYVFGRGTGIYRRDGNGTGTVPDQHTVPPYSWMRTDILVSFLQNHWIFRKNRAITSPRYFSSSNDILSASWAWKPASWAAQASCACLWIRRCAGQAS